MQFSFDRLQGHAFVGMDTDPWKVMPAEVVRQANVIDLTVKHLKSPLFPIRIESEGTGVPEGSVSLALKEFTTLLWILRQDCRSLFCPREQKV
jgi:hypothetical protein